MSPPTISPTISIVIPTRDRPELLARCLGAVLDVPAASTYEIVVVNDGGVPVTGRARTDPRVRVVEAGGNGPAAARNAGIAAARGDIVLFTDDDAIPEPGWVDATVAAFAAHPEAVGVAGKVDSPPTDWLYQRTVRSGDSVGNYLTCNIAYRAADLAAVGGFDEGFPHAHAEDRELGQRMEARGPVLFDGTMRVNHPPHDYTLRQGIRRARLLESDWRLYLVHPELRPARWSTRWAPFTVLAGTWARRIAHDRSRLLAHPGRLPRLGALVGGQLAVALWVTLTRWRPAQRAAVRPAATPAAVPEVDDEHPLRVAFIGGDPEPGGGVGGCAWTVVEQLGRLGCAVDCYVVLPPNGSDHGLAQLPGVRVVGFDTGWRWNRWYSRNSTNKMLSGLRARARGRQRLAALLRQQHAREPYDVVYQFSTIEVFGLRRHRDRLPPLVLHPSTHVAGELAGFRRERHLAAKCEPRWRRAVVELLLRVRSRRQRRDIGLADAVIGISQVFADHLARDYGVPAERFTVIPYPISPPADGAATPDPDGLAHVAMVSRVSVRKGIDTFVELSHRLGDLQGRVHLDLIGGETQWSDYRPLLTGLDPAMATYLGGVRHHRVLEHLRRAAVLVQPATFEPFGLSVGEALASGTPVVATAEVGAAEGVDPRCCAVVPASDVDAFEAALRAMLDVAASADGPAIRALARAEAARLFAPERVGAMILAVLRATARGPR